MATKRPGDDTNGHSGNGHAPDAKKTKDVSNLNILVKLAILDLDGCLFILNHPYLVFVHLIGAPKRNIAILWSN